MINPDILLYNQSQTGGDRLICQRLAETIDQHLPQADNKVWHAHPVWFIDGNPIVGYSKQKAGIRLMFWSGADFDEVSLKPGTGKFKDASVFYNSVEEVDTEQLQLWLSKSTHIQWDYKNIVKNKGQLHKIG